MVAHEDDRDGLACEVCEADSCAVDVFEREWWCVVSFLEFFLGFEQCHVGYGKHVCYLTLAIVLLTMSCCSVRMGFIVYESGMETVYARNRRELHRIAAVQRFSCPNVDDTDVIEHLRLFFYRTADFDGDHNWHCARLLDDFSVEAHVSSLDFLVALPAGARRVRDAYAFQPNPLGVSVIPVDCFEALCAYDWQDVQEDVRIPRYRP